MVKSPDYVYGIVPDSGEYGFEQQPSVADEPVLSRVRSLVGSFQWIGTDAANPVAIVVDRGTPNLIARFTTDPGDPDGRLSLRMHVWTCRSDHEIAELLSGIWPSEQSLPLTMQEFLSAVSGLHDGRWIVGSADQFTAVDFIQNWGGRSGKPHLASTRRPNAASRNVKQQQAVSSSSRGHSSSKLVAFLMTLVAMLGIAAAVKFYWDYETASTSATQANNDLASAKEDLADLKTQLSSANEMIQQKQIEMQRQRRNLEAAQIEIAQQAGEVERLRGIVNGDRELIDQKELVDLRRLEAVVKKYVADTSAARQQLEDAIPGPPSVLETIKNKIQDVGNGKDNAP
jgi:hypothetical protein